MKNTLIQMSLSFMYTCIYSVVIFLVFRLKNEKNLLDGLNLMQPTFAKSAKSVDFGQKLRILVKAADLELKPHFYLSLQEDNIK